MCKDMESEEGNEEVACYVVQCERRTAELRGLEEVQAA
jgi:hypothetical protein